MKTRLLLVIALIALTAPAALADTLTTGASWSPWSTPTQHNTVPFGGNPFWDNVSKDGSSAIPGGNNCNVGFWVSGTGNCSVTNFYSGSPLATGSFLGDGSSGFTFTADGTTNVVKAAVGVSALSATTEFGWFEAGDTSAKHAVISGGSIGGTTTFSIPSGAYGFYVSVVDQRPGALTPTATFYSNQNDALGRTHFALFNLGGGRFVLGIEDKQGDVSGRIPGWSDYDYNDLVLELSSVPVPEPASVMLLGVGLIGSGVLLRRRRRS